MKKTIGFLSLMVILTAIACNNKPAEEKKEIIVTPPLPSAPVVKDPPAKDITIDVDTNGMKVETKKVGVSVNKN